MTSMMEKQYSAEFRKLFAYDNWPSRQGKGWHEGAELYEDDKIDFHVDLGCGKLPKARIGIDRYQAPGVALITDLNLLKTYYYPSHSGGDAELETRRYDKPSKCIPREPFIGRLPFDNNMIESYISHHTFEHIGEGFIHLMDEIYRTLKSGGILRAIVPLFPSWAAVSDPDHCRYFMADEDSNGNVVSSWNVFCGTPGDEPENNFLASFSVPYTKARFQITDLIYTPQIEDKSKLWTPDDVREMRVTMRAVK